MATTSEHVGFGYHQDGVEIIVDKDTFRTGRKAPVMIVTPASDRYVLFTVEGADLHDYELVHVPGTVKLVEVAVGEQHVPNIWLSAAMVQGGAILTDMEEVTVPATEHFLEVAVEADGEVYGPGEQGMLTIRTTDVDGKPVSAEVAVGLVDESIYYIQDDLAGDPRPFFFGDRQGHAVGTAGSFDAWPFVRLVVDEKGRLWDERNWKQRQIMSEEEERTKVWMNADLRGDVSGSLFDDQDGAYEGMGEGGGPSFGRGARSRRAGGAMNAPASESLGADSRSELLFLGKSADMEAKGLPGRIVPLYCDIGPTREWGHPQDSTHWRRFPDYAVLPWRYVGENGLHPELVLIDGRFRVACMLATCVSIRSEVEILVDDYGNRPNYHVVEEIMRPIQIVDERMAIFRAEPGIVTAEFLLHHLDVFFRPYH